MSEFERAKSPKSTFDLETLLIIEERTVDTSTFHIEFMYKDFLIPRYLPVFAISVVCCFRDGISDLT